ncbi:hypothetical protein HD806DRAFT_498715 [Xylariaceae sp. AK1471]|nr:hypothetical protein HD806DRAFT_498715 [Xylariaceae sp. AK1471]
MAVPNLRCVVPLNTYPPIVQLHTSKVCGDFYIIPGVATALNHPGVIIDIAKPGQPQDLRLVCGCLRADGHLCGSVMKNFPHNVRSHKSDLHKPGSEYEKNQDESKQFQCRDCDRVNHGFHKHLGHCRLRHGFTGNQDIRKGDQIN